MKTSYSLIIVDCEHASRNIMGNVYGPFLFGSKIEAQSRLLSYIKSRMIDSHLSLLSELALEYLIDPSDYTDGTTFTMTPEQALRMFSENEDTLTPELLSDWYSNLTNDDECYFAFDIKQVPTTSLMEQLHCADAIEIDGNFIRHFSLASPDDCTSDNDELLDASFGAGDYKECEYSFTKSEIENALYDEALNAWSVVGLHITCISFAK